VLNPDAVGPLAFRTGLAVDLLEQGPTVAWGNPSEVSRLAGVRRPGPRRRQHRQLPGRAAPRLRRGGRTGSVVAVSGAVDYIADGATVLQVRTWQPLMTRVSGVGYALGALVAACWAGDEFSSRLLDQSAGRTLGDRLVTLADSMNGLGIGLELTAPLAAGTSLPRVAFGGIDTGNAAQVRATGVNEIAVCSAIFAAANPQVTAAALRRTEQEQTQR